MSYFPFFADIENRRALVVGGGKVAARKIEKLLPFGPEIVVVSPSVCSEIQAMKGIEIIERKFTEDLLTGCAFVIAATDDRKVNREISEKCREKNIPVNSVDDLSGCSFVFPAIVKDGEAVVGISTGGKSPAASAWLRRKIEKTVPKGFGEAAETLGAIRSEIKPCFPDEKERSEFLTEVLEKLLVRGKVYIIGAGCGEYDLITVKGLNAIKSCDAVVYDDLIDERLLDEAPRRAELIYVGKRKGKHSAAQEEINSILIKLAKEGKTVARLKGGDPFVFGRGGEEILALKDNGIDYEEIPGISSAIAVPAMAGIPVTHRGLSRSVHIITAHTAEDKSELPEWYDELAQLPGTLVFLMGISKLEKIAGRLIAAGMDPSTPAAVISGGTDGKSKASRAALKDIFKTAEKDGMKSPAVIVVGSVAGLNLAGDQ